MPANTFVGSAPPLRTITVRQKSAFPSGWLSAPPPSSSSGSSLLDPPPAPAFTRRGEISTLVNRKIPKSTLTEWCKEISLPSDYLEKINKLNSKNLGKARSIAVAINRIKREELLTTIQQTNLPIAQHIISKEVAKIALAMLCLGEASKSGGSSNFYLGSSNPKIIILFIELLKYCFDFKPEKIRATVQCRSDQDIQKLEKYWQTVTKIPSTQFYKTRIDPRTIGKPTRKAEYKGVLKVDYFNRKIQLELESLSNLIYNIVSEWAGSAVG